MNYRQPGEGQLMDGEGAGMQLPSTDLHFPSSGPGFLSSECYAGFHPYSGATSSKPSLIVLLEAMPSCSASVTFLAFIAFCLVLKLYMNASYLLS